MLGKFILLLFILPFLVCAKDYSKLYNKLDDSVVIIYSDTEQIHTEKNQLVSETASSLGTGTLINENGLILTAAHVVHSADELTVAVKNKGKYNIWADLRDKRVSGTR